VRRALSRWIPQSSGTRCEGCFGAEIPLRRSFIGVNIEVIPKVRSIVFSFAVFLGARVRSTSSAQTISPKHKQSKKTTAPSMEMQIRQMREDLQNQIGQLKVRLATNNLVYTSFRYYIP
jgi:hypothetical protein